MIVKIETYFDGKHWCARGTREDIFTQGTTYDKLLTNIKEAVSVHFEDELNSGDKIDILVMSEMEVSGVQEIAAG